jgi:hypothetical protein
MWHHASLKFFTRMYPPCQVPLATPLSGVLVLVRHESGPCATLRPERAFRGVGAIASCFMNLRDSLECTHCGSVASEDSFLLSLDKSRQTSR